MISEARPKNLNNIAAIHRAVLKHTFTSQVGESFIAKLYGFLIKDNSTSKVLVVMESGVVEGFISLTKDRTTTNERTMNLLGISDKLHLLLFVLLHPQTINGLYSKIRLDQYIEKKYKNKYPSILTLGVFEKCQGRGIGRTLVLKANKYFKDEGFSKYYVDTDINNGAVKFYLKLGFKPLTTISGNVILEKAI
jgi:ribosomal protein S18 acetylase RimI-like enzyme